jgi:hypothetical protein
MSENLEQYTKSAVTVKAVSSLHAEFTSSYQHPLPRNLLHLFSTRVLCIQISDFIQPLLVDGSLYSEQR